MHAEGNNYKQFCTYIYIYFYISIGEKAAKMPGQDNGKFKKAKVEKVELGID